MAKIESWIDVYFIIILLYTAGLFLVVWMGGFENIIFIWTIYSVSWVCMVVAAAIIMRLSPFIDAWTEGLTDDEVENNNV